MTAIFDLSDYKEFFNEQVKGLPVYHTIGNHDNDMNAIGQFKAKNPFAVTIAPPYYSFNIGDVHYVVLDNIDCSKYVGGGSSNRGQSGCRKDLFSPVLMACERPFLCRQVYACHHYYARSGI